jgi:hypothetical protein
MRGRYSVRSAQRVFAAKEVRARPTLLRPCEPYDPEPFLLDSKEAPPVSLCLAPPLLAVLHEHQL